MNQSLKDAVSVCKAIMRNGFDAYIINPRLQEAGLADPAADQQIIELCTDMGLDDLRKIYPSAEPADQDGAVASLCEGKNVYLFHQADAEAGSYPEESLAKVTPRLLRRFEDSGEFGSSYACSYIPRPQEPNDGFADFSEGEVRLIGLPDETLKRGYLRAIRALRYSANYHLPLEANTRLSILRNARRVLDYVSVSDIMDEWRKVEAENMWTFVNLLYESMILHGLLPEIAAMARIKQMKNETEEETVFDHTLEVMRRYPEELPYDWYGTMACLFHDVGKLYTADFFEGRWTFYQHHLVGAKITRKIMQRLRFLPQEIDLVCHLVQHHMRFHFMLTDRGIRRFRALDDYPRLMEMVRADLKARGGLLKEFNHNIKMLERADLPEEASEPFLNGNEIMQHTGINPGPAVGLLREALLKAQTVGDVANRVEAIDFVKRLAERDMLNR